MAKNQPKAPAPEASAPAAPAAAPVADETAAAADAGAATSDDADAAAPGADTGDTGAGPFAEPVATTSALVQVDAHIAGVRYLAGVVIEGLPTAVAEQYVGVVDPHPSAVSHAVAAGARVLQFVEA